jgi:hypothetical protein
MVVVCRQRNHHLTFRVREGDGDGGGMSTEKPPPPSHVSSEEGGWRWWWYVDRETTPSISRFE